MKIELMITGVDSMEIKVMMVEAYLMKMEFMIMAVMYFIYMKMMSFVMF